jgi:rhodanese-related sulfurtransferase/rubrerythrin
MRAARPFPEVGRARPAKRGGAGPFLFAVRNGVDHCAKRGMVETRPGRGVHIRNQGVPMFWKQFLTPVDRLSPEGARAEIDAAADGALTVLDVRQPEEYRQGHIPGALLIPLPELEERSAELDPDGRIITYCAAGGRSRTAAQLLGRLGFKHVSDVKGGFRAWRGDAALGDADQGLQLFDGAGSPEEALLVAYGMEVGLGDFYRTMADRVEADMVRSVFVKLAVIEDKHKDRIFAEYSRLTGDADRAGFEERVLPGAMEGGLTTREYENRYFPDWDSAVDVVGFAMSIEAQAYDLYVRASERADDITAAEVLRKVAAEEKEHLKRLGRLIGEIA